MKMSKKEKNKTTREENLKDFTKTYFHIPYYKWWSPIRYKYLSPHLSFMNVEIKDDHNAPGGYMEKNINEWAMHQARK